jgi:hypothetical protein
VGKSSPSTLSVYKTRPFARFARKAHVSDADLWNAAQRADQGVIDADLGGGVIKQRIARAGGGKSGGSRSIILFKKNKRAVYVHGFEKKNKANIGPDELEAFRRFAEIYFGYTNEEMTQRVEDGTIFKVAKPEGEDNA